LQIEDPEIAVPLSAEDDAAGCSSSIYTVLETEKAQNLTHQINNQS